MINKKPYFGEHSKYFNLAVSGFEPFLYTRPRSNARVALNRKSGCFTAVQSWLMLGTKIEIIRTAENATFVSILFNCMLKMFGSIRDSQSINAFKKTLKP